MNRRFGLLALGAVVLLGAPGAANAQVKGYAGLGGGVAIPLGDFGDVAKLGWLAQATAGFSTSSIIGARANVTYGQHSGKEGFDGKLKILGVMADLVISPRTAGRIAPYILAGAGIANEKNGDSETKFAWNAGAGIRARILYVEARFVSVKHTESNTNFVPITVGVRIGGN
jgi:hypothetical protein